MRKIESVKRNWENPAYCKITLNTGAKVQRKVYNRKDGHKLIVIDNNIWAFKYDLTDEGINIKHLGKRSKDANNEELENLKIEDEIENEVEEEAEDIEEVTEDIEDGEIKHEKYEQIKACIEADIPVYLVGPAGSGKNHTLEQIAEDLGLEFYFTTRFNKSTSLLGL